MALKTNEGLYYGWIVGGGLLAAGLVIWVHLTVHIRAQGPTHYDRVQLQRMLDDLNRD